MGVSDCVAALEGAIAALKASDKLEIGGIADPKVRTFFASLSPISNVAKIKAPMLLLRARPARARCAALDAVSWRQNAVTRSDQVSPR